MARIRTLKPTIWLSPQIMNLSFGSRLLFIGLITQADDHGRGTADVRKMKAAVFAGDDVTAADVSKWFDEIAGQRLAVLYETADHGRCYAIPTWKEHQVIQRPKESVYPAPGSVIDESLTNQCAVIDESLGIGREGNGREGTLRESRPSTKGTRIPEDWNPSDSTSVPPDMNLAVETEKFRDYWRSATGAKAVKADWDATWRNWVRRSVENNQYSKKAAQKWM